MGRKPTLPQVGRWDNNGLPSTAFRSVTAGQFAVGVVDRLVLFNKSINGQGG